MSHAITRSKLYACGNEDKSLIVSAGWGIAEGSILGCIAPMLWESTHSPKGHRHGAPGSTVAEKQRQPALMKSIGGAIANPCIPITYLTLL